MYRDGFGPIPLRSPCRRLLGAVAAAALVCGCGGPATCPVRGKIVFQDNQAAATELAGYVVTLESVEGQVSASGVVKPDGTFEVSTYKPGDGAVPGRHRVAVTPPNPFELIETPGAKPTRALVPANYGALETSGLEITVDSSGREAVLTLKRAAPDR